MAKIIKSSGRLLLLWLLQVGIANAIAIRDQNAQSHECRFKRELKASSYELLIVIIIIIIIIRSRNNIVDVVVVVSGQLQCDLRLLVGGGGGGSDGKLSNTRTSSRLFSDGRLNDQKHMTIKFKMLNSLAGLWPPLARGRLPTYLNNKMNYIIIDRFPVQYIYTLTKKLAYIFKKIDWVQLVS